MNWTEAENLARWAMEYALNGEIPWTEARAACEEAADALTKAGLEDMAEMWKREAKACQNIPEGYRR